MEILKIEVNLVGVFRDGGTRHYADKDGGEYFVDNRIRSSTVGKVYDKYPTEEGARILPLVELIEVKI